jgi:hypothetical protein
MSSMASSIRSQCARQRDGNRLCHGSRGPRPAFALPPPMPALSSLFELIPRNQRTTKASKPFMTTSSLRSEKSSLLRPDGPLLSFLSTGRTLLFSSTLGSTLVSIQQQCLSEVTLFRSGFTTHVVRVFSAIRAILFRPFEHLLSNEVSYPGDVANRGRASSRSLQVADRAITSSALS